MTETATTSVTFEDGYERLQRIATRLNQEDVPVSEMCDLFEQGKDLEQTLTAYLDTQKARVEAIQNGEGVRKFSIAGGQAAAKLNGGTEPAPAATTRADEIPVDTADFVPTTRATAVADDDIPF
jgi:exodeoxyribonuclease VII small subunit